MLFMEYLRFFSRPVYITSFGELMVNLRKSYWKSDTSMHLVLSGWFISFVIILSQIMKIKNPVIMPDECAYSFLIKTFAKFFTWEGAQYPPLYPLLSSFFWNESVVLDSYYAIRIFNVVVFSLSFFPIFFTIKEVLPQDNHVTQKYRALFLSMFIILMPWSSIISPIWAEPLFYFLLTSCFYFSIRCFKTEKIIYFCLLGIATGLLFLTKQAGAILFIFSFIITNGFRFFQNGQSKKRTFFQTLVTAVIYTIILGAYAGYNYLKGIPSIGYAAIIKGVNTELDTLILKVPIYQNFFHQISYLITASYFIFFISFVLYFFKFSKLQSFQKYYLLLVSLCGLGISALLAIFLNVGQSSYDLPDEPKLCYGRYLAPVIPQIIILGFCGLSYVYEVFSENWKKLLITATILYIFLAIFSPIYSVNSSGIFNAADISYLSKFYGYLVPPEDRRLIDDHVGLGSWLLPLGLIVLSAFYLYLNKKYFKISVVYGFCLLFFTSSASYRSTFVMANSQRLENQIFMYIAEKKVTPDEILFYSSFKPSLYICMFWMGYFDVEAWVKHNSVADMDALKEKLKKSQYKYIMASLSDLKKYEAIHESTTARLISLKDIRKDLAND